MINWEVLHHVARHQRGGEAIQVIVADAVRRFGFRKDEATKPNYSQVATFLEEGWTAQERYLKLQAGIDPATFGVVMNRLIGGSRFDQRKADFVGAPWLGKGVWPTPRRSCITKRRGGCRHGCGQPDNRRRTGKPVRRYNFL